MINSIDDWDRHGGVVPVNKGIVTQEDRTLSFLLFLKRIRKAMTKKVVYSYFIEKENVWMADFYQVRKENYFFF